MADAMVTGRMSSAKKRAGNRVLAALGISASQAINQLYDHLIEEGSLPFSGKQVRSITAQERAEARSFVRSIPKKNRFSSLTDAEIKRSKLEKILS